MTTIAQMSQRGQNSTSGPEFAASGSGEVFEAVAIRDETDTHYSVEWKDTLMTQSAAKQWLKVTPGEIVKTYHGGKKVLVHWDDSHILKKDASKALVAAWEADLKEEEKEKEERSARRASISKILDSSS